MPVTNTPYPIHVASADEYKQALQVRIHVFVEIQKFSRDLEPDEHDPTATHIVVLDPTTNNVVGTLRILKTLGAAKLGRVAVLPEYQGLGLGKKMIEFAEKYIADHWDSYRCDVVKLGSQMDKIGFYERCGFVREGEVFDDDGAPHVWMVKAIGSSG